jgi:hypothetical protein
MHCALISSFKAWRRQKRIALSTSAGATPLCGDPLSPTSAATADNEFVAVARSVEIGRAGEREMVDGAGVVEDEEEEEEDTDEDDDDDEYESAVAAMSGGKMCAAEADEASEGGVDETTGAAEMAERYAVGSIGGVVTGESAVKSASASM